MYRRLPGLLLSGAAALAIGLVATPAFAATTLTVTVTGGGTFAAKAATTTMKNGSVAVTCSTVGAKPASTVTAVIKNAAKTGTSPVQVGTVTALAFNNCTGPLGAVTATPAKLPYQLKADSVTNGQGETAVLIAGITVNVSTAGCTFTVTGSVSGYYDNTTHALGMTPTPPVKPLNKAQLTVSNVGAGCPGAIKNGGHPTSTASYSITPKTLSIKST